MNTTTEQLKQCLTATWDGNLISKEARDHLVKHECIARAHGYNFITAKGIDTLLQLGLIAP